MPRGGGVSVLGICQDDQYARCRVTGRQSSKARSGLWSLERSHFDHFLALSPSRHHILLLLVLPPLPSSCPWGRSLRSVTGRFPPGRAGASRPVRSWPDCNPSVRSGPAVSLPKTLMSLQKCLLCFIQNKIQMLCRRSERRVTAPPGVLSGASNAALPPQCTCFCLANSLSSSGFCSSSLSSRSFPLVGETACP